MGTQAVEIQLALKDYDPQKDKRFVGTVRLPNIPRPNLKICMIADEKHKTGAKKYDILIASDTVIKKVPVVCGPVLNRIQKFPVTVSHNQPLILSVQDLRASVKFQLRKVTCMGCCAGREDMTDDELRQNI